MTPPLDCYIDICLKYPQLQRNIEIKSFVYESLENTATISYTF